MVRASEELDRAALDIALTLAMGLGIHLTERDISMLRLGIIVGSLDVLIDTARLEHETKTLPHTDPDLMEVCRVQSCVREREKRNKRAARGRLGD